MIALSITLSLSFIVWHRKFDHMNFFSLRQYLKRLNHFFQNDCINNYCDVCKLIKIKKKLNKKNIHHVKETFYIIHIDFVSITIENFENERYYINITNDKIRWTKIYIVKNKYEWFQCFIDLINWIKCQFDVDVKIVRTNYDNEFRNISTTNYFVN